MRVSAVAAGFGRRLGDGPGGDLAQLGEQDAAQAGIGIDEHEVVGRGRGQPLQHAGAHGGFGQAEFAGGVEEAGDVVVDALLGGGGRLGVGADVDAAAAAALGPAFLLELAIARADGVGMQREAARQLAGAGQAVAGAEIAGEDGEDHLGDQLPVDGDFGAVGEPETHRSCQFSVAQLLSCSVLQRRIQREGVRAATLNCRDETSTFPATGSVETAASDWQLATENWQLRTILMPQPILKRILEERATLSREEARGLMEQVLGGQFSRPGTGGAAGRDYGAGGSAGRAGGICGCDARCGYAGPAEPRRNAAGWWTHAARAAMPAGPSIFRRPRRWWRRRRRTLRSRCTWWPSTATAR